MPALYQYCYCLLGGPLQQQLHSTARHVHILNDAIQVHFCCKNNQCSRYGTELKQIAVGPDADQHLQTGRWRIAFGIQ